MANDGRQIRVHVAERGNVFMREIAEWLVGGLADLGRRAELCVGGVPVAAAEVINLVVAPHELFELSGFDDAQRRQVAAASVPICTEQPGTPWFEIQLPSIAYSPLVLDISRLGVQELRRRGLPAAHLPLGYQAGFDRWHGEQERPRPIDVLFLGSLTERRQQVIASMAEQLQSLTCRFLLFEPTRPARAGDAGFVTGAAKHELLASTKVLLNVHRNEVPYFESVRALEAVANGAVVLSEPSLDLTPLRAVEHVVTAPAAMLGAMCRALVNDPDWLAQVRGDAYHHLRQRHSLAASLAAVLDDVERAAPHGVPRHPVPTVALHRLRAPRPVSALLAPAAPAAPAPPAPTGNGQDGMFKKVLLGQMQLRRRLDELECLVRHGSTRYDESVTTAAYDAVTPDVSVVIPCFDYGRFVVEAIDSVASSHGLVPEVIVIDDHSGDGASETVRRYLASHPWLAARLVTRHANAGLAAARNLGFELARSPFVFPLDADNSIYPHALSRLLDALLTSGAAAAYGMLEVFNDRRGVLSALDWSVERLVGGPYIDAAALIRKDVWAAVGGYEGAVSELYGWEDYDMWLKLADRGLRAEFVAEMLVRYRSHGESMIHTTNIETASLARVLRRRHRNLPWPVAG